MSPGNRHEPPVELEGGDIEIGAVELKDAATDSRASIEAANTARTTATKVIAVQNIDAAGNVATAKASAGQTIIYADIPANATSAATPEEIIALVSSEKFYIIELVLTFTVQDVVRLLDTVGTPVYRGTYQLPAYGGILLPRNADDSPHFVTTAGSNLGIVTAAVNSYSGHIIYWNAT